jgi:hypothetical protein
MLEKEVKELRRENAKLLFDDDDFLFDDIENNSSTSLLQNSTPSLLQNSTPSLLQNSNTLQKVQNSNDNNILLQIKGVSINLDFSKII